MGLLLMALNYLTKSINNHGHTVKNGINNVAYEMKKHR